jgi:hypothetical protein
MSSSVEATTGENRHQASPSPSRYVSFTDLAKRNPLPQVKLNLHLSINISISTLNIVDRSGRRQDLSLSEFIELAALSVTGNVIITLALPLPFPFSSPSPLTASMSS